ncbi:hypothetical protein BO70DRAFT_172435 [Aspergillus heteromorphus CBS 117.55]|uniref:Uncharacterized protein n=1 Tax=Aspergillus heteromorphus CBS 117.55 TaxID=1448321 RepID=A0A317UXV5_9EURO|nr:uncharacterized protein BO70DRAFT_172435 [Aspergillus heteromorphus CBS 117.55]PWY66426.1 hypothetical protein BO70DRAFT_172435 [Aspergillus heteromorphus CBS 117.55]
MTSWRVLIGTDVFAGARLIDRSNFLHRRMTYMLSPPLLSPKSRSSLRFFPFFVMSCVHAVGLRSPPVYYYCLLCLWNIRIYCHCVIGSLGIRLHQKKHHHY